MDSFVAEAVATVKRAFREPTGLANYWLRVNPAYFSLKGGKLTASKIVLQEERSPLNLTVKVDEEWVEVEGEELCAVFRLEKLGSMVREFPFINYSTTVARAERVIITLPEEPEEVTIIGDEDKISIVLPGGGSLVFTVKKKRDIYLYFKGKEGRELIAYYTRRKNRWIRP